MAPRKPKPPDKPVFGGGGGGKKKKKKEPIKLKSPFYPETLKGEGFEGRLPGQGQPGMPVPGAYTPNQAPLYQEGMQWEPTNWSPDEIWEIQQALMASGYASNLTAKVWDEKSANAFKNVLTAANHQGLPWQDVITAGVESEEAAAAASREAERGPLQVELTNPSDLAATGRGVASETIGREMSDEEAMQFAGEYQGQERLVQTDAYNRGLEAGEFTAPPDSEVAAEEWLKKHRTGEVLSTDAMKANEVWENMLAGRNWRLSSG